MFDVKMGVPVTLADGKERHLFFTARDAKAVRKIWDSQTEESDGLDMLAAVLHIGLKREDPELTEDTILDLIPMKNVRSLNDTVLEAMGVEKPKGVPEDVTAPLASTAPTSEK